MDTNPIYRRLVRRAGWNSDQHIMRLAGSIAAVMSVIGLMGLLLDPDLDTLAVTLIPGSIALTGLVIIVFSPFAFMLGAAVLTSQKAASEEFRLLRLTPMSTDSIVGAHVDAAQVQLRLLWAALIGVLPGAGVAAAHFAIAYSINRCPGDCGVALIFFTMMGVGVGLAVLALFGVLIVMLCWTAMLAGVWLGFQFGGAAGIAAGLASMIGLAGIVLMLIALLQGSDLCCAATCVMPFALPYGCSVLGGHLFDWAEAAVEARTMRDV
jgi:hypothetical protein